MELTAFTRYSITCALSYGRDKYNSYCPVEAAGAILSAVLPHLKVVSETHLWKQCVYNTTLNCRIVSYMRQRL